MASTLIQFRIEKDEKQRSSQILETMGLKRRYRHRGSVLTYVAGQPDIFAIAF